jgi:hypothetical protein
VVIHAILQTRHELHLLPSKTKESLGGPAPRTTESFKGMNDQGRAQLAGILPNPWKARKSRAEVQRFDNFGGTQAFKDSKRYLHFSPWMSYILYSLACCIHSIIDRFSSFKLVYTDNNSTSDLTSSKRMKPEDLQKLHIELIPLSSVHLLLLSVFHPLVLASVHRVVHPDWTAGQSVAELPQVLPTLDSTVSPTCPPHYCPNIVFVQYQGQQLSSSPLPTVPLPLLVSLEGLRTPSSADTCLTYQCIAFGGQTGRHYET